MEWYQDWWVIRTGVFDLSETPNSNKLDQTFGDQFQIVAEAEEDHTLPGEGGNLKLLGFLTHGRMGLFSDAIALSLASGTPARISLVRHVHERAGIGVNFEQHITNDLGIFLRSGYDEPPRQAMPVTGRKGKEAMPHARWRRWIRCPKG